MFFQLLYNKFIINKSNAKSKDTKYIYKECNTLLDLLQYAMMLKEQEPSYIVVDDYFFYQFLGQFCKSIKLTLDEYHTIIAHTIYSLKFVENTAEAISSYSTISFDLDQFYYGATENAIDKHILKFCTAEFFPNDYEHWNYYVAERILCMLKNYEYDCFKRNKSYKCLSCTFNDVVSNKSLQNNIINLVSDKYKQLYSIRNIDSVDHILKDAQHFYFNRFIAYKYNYKLAYMLKERDYNIYD